MTEGPLVSVILCTYQGAERVSGAIESVLRQDWPEFELIVVDDGSDDGTWDLITSISDRRVVLLRNDENLGLYQSRAGALRASRGRYVAFIDDDDRWIPSKLREQVAFLEGRLDVDVVHTRVIDVFPSGRRLARPLHQGQVSYEELLCHDHLATSSVLARRIALLDAGSYDVSRKAFGDWDLWTRVAKDHVIKSLDRPLVEVHLRSGSIQRGSVPTFEHERQRLLESRGPELARLGLTRRAMAGHHYAVAAKRLLAGDASGARRTVMRAIAARPTLQSVALLTLSLLPPRSRTRCREALRFVRVVFPQTGLYLRGGLNRRTM